MDVKHPRRMLILGAPDSGALEVVKGLTSSVPPLNENGSTAGITHEWHVKTAYYTANIPIWIDEIEDTEAWKREFLKAEAREVVEAVGAWVYCFKAPENGHITSEVRDTLAAVREIVEEHVGYAANTVMLAVAMPRGKLVATSAKVDHADWEDLCIEHGFEYVDYAGQGMNEFREKTGFERLKEALEANEWVADDVPDDSLDLSELDFEGGDDLKGFARDEAEMTAELFGMKAALESNESDEDHQYSVHEEADQVENLDRLMGRLLVIKEQSADLPEAQRKRMAANAVKELMRDEREI